MELLKHSETDKRNKRLEVGKRAASDAVTMAMHQAMVEHYPELDLLIPLYRRAGFTCSEIQGFKWDHIDKDRGVVWVLDLLWSKTANGIRLIPVNQKLRQILLPRQESADSEFVFPQGIRKAKAKDYGVAA